MAEAGGFQTADDDCITVSTKNKYEYKNVKPKKSGTPKPFILLKNCIKKHLTRLNPKKYDAAQNQ